MLNAPYTLPLPVPLAAGQMIVLEGEVWPQANGFALDLQCGLSTNSDIALHVNPRQNAGSVVRNSRVNECWANEELTATQPFPAERGKQFFLHIFVTGSQFLIAFNGHHYCSFTHRMPLSRVQAIRVNGDLNIFHLEHRHKNVEEYPQPSRIAVSKAIPTLPCTANPNQCCSYITQPNAPYTLPLPVPLAAGQMIALEGEVLPQANGFGLDLQCGLSTNSDIALHVSPRQNAGSVVRNSRVNECWANEELTATQPFPAERGKQFFLHIFVTGSQFLIAFNGHHYCSFTHRMPLSRVQAIRVNDDLNIFHLEHRRNVTEYPYN